MTAEPIEKAPAIPVTDRTLEIIARPGASLEGLGRQLSFYGRALAWSPRPIRG